MAAESHEPHLAPSPSILFVAVQPYTMGRHSYIGEFSHISQYTTIGNFVSISNLVTIGAAQHSLDKLTTFPFMEIQTSRTFPDTWIGSDVWIGCNSVIMAGVRVGHGAVIGAGAIVTKDVPPYAIVIGAPAKVRRYRFPPEIIEGLLETAWWDLPTEVITKLPFSDPVAAIAAARAYRNKA